MLKLTIPPAPVPIPFLDMMDFKGKPLNQQNPMQLLPLPNIHFQRQKNLEFGCKLQSEV